MTDTYGENAKEAAIIDMIIDGEEDWRSRYAATIHSRPPYQNWDESVAEYRNNYLPHMLSIYEVDACHIEADFLQNLLKKNQEGKGFWVGNKVSKNEANIT